MYRTLLVRYPHYLYPIFSSHLKRDIRTATTNETQSAMSMDTDLEVCFCVSITRKSETPCSVSSLRLSVLCLADVTQKIDSVFWNMEYDPCMFRYARYSTQILSVTSMKVTRVWLFCYRHMAQWMIFNFLIFFFEKISSSCKFWNLFFYCCFASSNLLFCPSFSFAFTSMARPCSSNICVYLADSIANTLIYPEPCLCL
jgi:hypothetical protein